MPSSAGYLCVRPQNTYHSAMNPPTNARDFDSEIAEMIALATSLTRAVPIPQMSFPTPGAAELPGVSVITNEDPGEANANAGEDRR